ncbi:MAG: InlB B-repeat-containing protein, partial [Christensenellales bacterium]
AIEYTIKLNLNGGSVASGSSIKYTIESEDITLSDASKNGYTFTGWTGEGVEDATKNITVLAGSYGNKEYSANYDINHYAISYNYAGGGKEAFGSYLESYTIESETYTPSGAVKAGYVFLAWELRDENGNLLSGQSIVKGSTGNRTYTATYVADTETVYTVNHYKEQLDGSYALAYSTKFTGETDTQVTPAVEVFEGFTCTTPDGTEITISGDGLSKVDYYYTRNSYTVRVITNGYVDSIADASYKFEESVTLHANVKAGYRFTGWSGTSDNGKTFGTDYVDITFNMPSGNVTLRAYADEISYTITIKYNDGVTQDKVISYNYFSSDISLDRPTRLGYNFIGWSGTDIIGDYQMDVVIPKGSMQDKQYTAHWEIINYTIAYELNDGEVASENVTEYTVESATITLVNPSKVGYTFIGWSGTDLVGTNNKTVKIIKGSVGDRSYTANYEADDVMYKVSHKIMDINGTTYSDYVIDTLYAKTDSTVMPAVKDIVGFTAPEVQSKIVKADGTTEIEYLYTRNQHNVVLTADDDGLSQLVGNGTYYYGASVEISASVKAGYEFANWTGYINETKLALNILMPDEDVDLTAKTVLIPYTLTFDLNKGTLPNGVVLPNGYTVITPDLTIDVELVRIGYEFLGWESVSLDHIAKTFTISQGSIGNRAYVAKWQAIHYGIDYALNGGMFEVASASEYNIESDEIIIGEPIRLGYTFTGWSGTDLVG